MLKHFLKITAIIILIVLCIFYPFIPGDYDMFAESLSFTAQVLGFSGLLLVPFGIIWLIYEIVKKGKKDREQSKSYYFALTSSIISGFIVLTGLIGAFYKSRVLGIIFLLACIRIYFTVFAKLRLMKNEQGNSINPTPFYLIFIPVSVMLIRLIFIVPAAEFSRNHAIEQSTELIRDIEEFHKKNKHYPVSLQALWSDYSPSVTGIEKYYYEPNGNSYNLYFKQLSDELDVEEIVMYNKSDEHAFTSHTRDLLEFTGEELNLRRGDSRRYNLSAEHWIYFKFD